MQSSDAIPANVFHRQRHGVWHSSFWLSTADGEEALTTITATTHREAREQAEVAMRDALGDAYVACEHHTTR